MLSDETFYNTNLYYLCKEAYTMTLMMEEQIHALVETYSNMVYRQCWVYLKNKEDAEDAFQDVFIKIIEKAPPFLSKDHEKAWIIRVTCNHCKNTLRFKKYRSLITYNENIDKIDDKSLESDLLKDILELPLQYRNVLYLYYYEGYNTKEIAHILVKKEATIRTWLKRGREKLKTVLGGEESE
jgi:RNA polymerase sigma-70 factor (ECF subfamily)